MMALIGALAYEFQVALPQLARFGVHGDALTYGLMTSAMGLGVAITVLAGARISGCCGETNVSTNRRRQLDNRFWETLPAVRWQSVRSLAHAEVAGPAGGCRALSGVQDAGWADWSGRSRRSSSPSRPAVVPNS